MIALLKQKNNKIKQKKLETKRVNRKRTLLQVGIAYKHLKRN